MTVTEGVFVGLGSNLENRVENISRATDKIRIKSVRLKSSSVYQSNAVGFSNQPRFLNSVCEVTTRLSLWDFLSLLMSVERNLGRSRSFHNSPRLIDLDILLWGSAKFHQPGLVIPHPRMMERGFVLAPLLELRPSLTHPCSGDSLRSIFEALNDFEKPSRENVFRPSLASLAAGDWE